VILWWMILGTLDEMHSILHYLCCRIPAAGNKSLMMVRAEMASVRNLLYLLLEWNGRDNLHRGKLDARDED
jgi:hypothetical protein